MASTTFRPRRSCLYIPGGNARALEKAKTLPADMLIFDLEDAVAPDAKADARAAVVAAVGSAGYGKREIIVRINAMNTPWGMDDIAAIAGLGADGIVLPKVETARDIAAIDTAFSAAGASAQLGLWAMVEMPLCILNIHDIAAASSDTRLCGFVMGINDLAKEMRAQQTPDRHAFQTALSLSVTAARAYGLIAIDGVYNDFSNPEGLATECKQGRIMGFDGKTLIHPDQLAIANQVFAPSADEVHQAKAIVQAFAAPDNAGKGVIQLNGKMTELLHLEQAKNILATHQAIIDLAH
jgi:citrate lyase subunit beta / citryl-CoA lyase